MCRVNDKKMFLKDTEQMGEAQVLSLQIQCSFLHSFLPSIIDLTPLTNQVLCQGLDIQWGKRQALHSQGVCTVEGKDRK